MATFNQWMGIGHLGKDPILDVTSEGKPYTRFSIAVDQGRDKKAMWLNIVCWDKLAEQMEKFLYKGAQAFVQGRLQISTYKDKQKVERQSIERPPMSNYWTRKQTALPSLK